MCSSDLAWEVAAPVLLATIAFRYSGRGGGAEGNEANRRILDAVNASGEAFLTHTVLDGRTVLRASIGNLRTEASHIDRLWDLLSAAAQEVGRTE